jgi:hypothetical protein
MQLFRQASCLSLMSLASLFGQGPTLTGTGYVDPSRFFVAPGQITTLFVTGLKTILPSEPIKAQAVPLPTSLAGISVILNQPGLQASTVPLLSFQQISTCSDGSGSPASSGSVPECLQSASRSRESAHPEWVRGIYLGTREHLPWRGNARRRHP